MSTNQPEIVTAVLEYSPRLKKAFIRGVLKQGETLTKLDPENLQNHVQVFLGVDHGYGVGISPLIIDENGSSEVARRGLSEGDSCPTCGHPLHTEDDRTRCTWCAYCRPAGTRAGVERSGSANDPTESRHDPKALPPVAGSPIRVPCDWICPACGQMEVDELARDEHECDPGLLSENAACDGGPQSP